MKLRDILRWLRLASWAVSPLLFAAEAGDPYMGRWEGHYRGEGSDTGPFQIHVVPQGGVSYQLWVKLGERGSRYEVAGTRENDVLRFRGRFQVVSGTDDAAYELGGEIRGGRLTGSYESPEGNGTIELTKIAPVPPVSPERPGGALQLFDGGSLAHWQRPDGGPPDWRLQPDGSMEAAGMDLVSRKTFASFRLHVEFLLPLMASARGQERANSGIVLAGSHEVHILDTFGGEPSKTSGGAIWGAVAPRLEATLPPLAWQVLDVTLRAQVSVADGRQMPRAEISAVLNGVPIHERRVLDGFRESAIRLRSSGSAVRFRNIWIVPLADEARTGPTSRCCVDEIAARAAE